eukprot:CAMPEP_0172165944 /NCGR_PEP_ID=MMETSP1050-20130122/8696_1 /TAXON_ID=233186 /ORGANISM="Cryptomonas curvata, Strain CCAP979/52" /LENGTH=220 /DNA_ID=CAMNT_0012836477 /DNA_START=370 /DNA_END=1029 /DNA_ORIENTATION=+
MSSACTLGLSQFEVTADSQIRAGAAGSSSLSRNQVDNADDLTKSTKGIYSDVQSQKSSSIASNSSPGGEMPPEAGHVCPLQPRRQHFSREEVVTIFNLRPNIRSLQTAECMRRVLTTRSKQVAQLHGVTPKAIRDIWHGHTWGAVTADLWDGDEKKLFAALDRQRGLRGAGQQPPKRRPSPATAAAGPAGWGITSEQAAGSQSSGMKPSPSPPPPPPPPP